jgi:hypothetical protein
MDNFTFNLFYSIQRGPSWRGEGLPALKADNLIAVCEPIVYKMWEPRHLTLYGPPRPVTRDR